MGLSHFLVLNWSTTVQYMGQVIVKPLEDIKGLKNPDVGRVKQNVE